MATMYDIQSPESIAKEYGGNKQTIAQAAQRGMIDPTAAVMAGMYIDRMTNAQAAQASQQPTVAQQVLTPPQAQGIPSVPNNTQYSDGGIVGYAGGGLADSIGRGQKYGEYDLHSPVYPFSDRELLPPLKNPEMTHAGPRENPFVAAYDKAVLGASDLMARLFDGDDYDIPPPKDKTAQVEAEGALAATSATGISPTPPTPSVPVAPKAEEAEPIAQSEHEYKDLEAYRDFLRGADERQQGQRKQDMWGGLAEFGFNMAASDKPTLFQAAGEAGAKVLPNVQERLDKGRDASATSMKDRAALDLSDKASNEKLRSAEMNRDTQLEVARLNSNRTSNYQAASVEAYKAGNSAMGDFFHKKALETNSSKSSGLGADRLTLEVNKAFNEAIQMPTSPESKMVKKLVTAGYREDDAIEVVRRDFIRRNLSMGSTGAASQGQMTVNSDGTLG